MNEHLNYKKTLSDENALYAHSTKESATLQMSIVLRGHWFDNRSKLFDPQ